jgi:hypothetical protein
MNVATTFVAHAQSAVAVQPRMSAFHNPASFTQPAAVGRAASGQDGTDAAFSQFAPMRIGVIGPVALHRQRPPDRPAPSSLHRRDAIDQRQKLRYIMAIGRGNRRRKRDAMGVSRDVVFRAAFPAIRGVWPSVRPPKTARTEALSTTARDQSILSAWWSLLSSAAWILFQMPAACQSRSRRQQVMPLPKPNSCGSSSQGMPLRSTKRMPLSAARLSSGFRPGYRRRLGRGCGNKGAMNSHNDSSKIGLAMLGPPCPTANVTRTGSFC